MDSCGGVRWIVFENKKWFCAKWQMSHCCWFTISIRLLNSLISGWLGVSSIRVRDFIDRKCKVNFSWNSFEKLLPDLCFWYAFFSLDFYHFRFDFDHSTVSWEARVVFNAVVTLWFGTCAAQIFNYCIVVFCTCLYVFLTSLQCVSVFKALFCNSSIFRSIHKL